MIATTLFGGLGNQMFIYATVRAISLKNKVGMAFNISQGFNDDKLFFRNLELSKFNLVIPESNISTFNIPMGKRIRAISRKLGFNLLSPKYKFIKEERPYHFQKSLLYQKLPNVYLEGYWQSPYYFEEYSNIIKNDFNIKINIRKEVQDELSLIKSLSDNIVMIGVRRYQECSSTKLIPGGKLTDINYYIKAMDLIRSKINKPVFIVFSQDQEWVRDNIPSGSNLYFVKPKDGENSAIEDLYLMQNCNHHIISNSSYYWWGAWLGNNPNKIVVAPDNFINKDTLCSNWIKLF